MRLIAVFFLIYNQIHLYIFANICKVKAHSWRGCLFILLTAKVHLARCRDGCSQMLVVTLSERSQSQM